MSLKLMMMGHNRQIKSYMGIGYCNININPYKISESDSKDQNCFQEEVMSRLNSDAWYH